MSSIQLSNFRKFQKLDTMSFCPINIFVGKNNAGKSTVVKAIMLILDNLRSLNWTNIPKEEGLQNRQLPKPLFRFDANGFHNLHIGTFERAKCNSTNDSKIVFDLEYEGIGFKIVVEGTEGGNHSMSPIASLVLNFPGGRGYEFNFSKGFMQYCAGEEVLQKYPEELTSELYQLNEEIDHAEWQNKLALEKEDVIGAAELSNKLQKLHNKRNSLEAKLAKEEENRQFNLSATFPLVYLHERIGENVLIQYMKSLLRYSESKDPYVGQGSTMLSGKTATDKRRALNGNELSMRSVVLNDAKLIMQNIEQVEQVLESIRVDYIQAHCATQQLIFRAEESKGDINTKVIDDFYKEHISEGSDTGRFISRWLKDFELGDWIDVQPLEGEGYYVKVVSGRNSVHLADMGMGSIQLVVLLLRLATIGNQSEKLLQPWWIFIEEPEQNLHPMLQSRLAELFFDFNQTFCDPYTHTLIVETHSEYLVRKTQLMVAEYVKEFGEDMLGDKLDFKVYYFPSNANNQPYDMQYMADGRFRQVFEEGFYDESGTLALGLPVDNANIGGLNFNWKEN